MNNLLAVLKELKQSGKIKDYGFEEHLYWNNVPVVYFNEGGRVFLAKIHSQNGTSNIYTLEDIKDDKLLRKKIDYILSKEKEIRDYCLYDLTQLQNFDIYG